MVELVGSKVFVSIALVSSANDVLFPDKAVSSVVTSLVFFIFPVHPKKTAQTKQKEAKAKKVKGIRNRQISTL